MSHGAPKSHIIAAAAKIVEEGLPIGPRLHPCVCGAGRHAHSGPARTGRHPATGCHKYRRDPADLYAEMALDAAERSLAEDLHAYGRLTHTSRPLGDGEWGIGPADIGACRRWLWYRENPPADYEPIPETPDDKAAAFMGSLIHDGAQVARKRLYPWRLFEQYVQVPGLDRRGRYDSYDPITRTLEDLKTAGEWKWDQVGEEGPSETWWQQAHLYALALEDEGIPVTTIRITVVQRSGGKDEVFERPYDRAYAERARAWLLDVLTALDLGQPLPRDRSGPTTDGLCRRCPARRHCWSMDQAAALGRSPESLTVLGETPVAEEVAWAIGQHVEWSTRKREAEKAREEVGALLEGVEPGVYGEYEGAPRAGSMKDDWKAHALRLRELLDLPRDMWPALDTMDTPPKVRTRGWIAWSRLRKATRERLARERVAETETVVTVEQIHPEPDALPAAERPALEAAPHREGAA